MLLLQHSAGSGDVQETLCKNATKTNVHFLPSAEDQPDPRLWFQCPVTCVSWCPLSPDVFLSCSSDWTIQLWQQDQLRPVISFTSAQRAVCDVQWSPRWAAVFGAVNEGQLEIWDLNWST